MVNLFSLLTDAADSEAGGGNIMFFIVIYGAFFAFMYFVLIRPQRRKQKETQNMQSSIKIGDPVMTNGGLYGTVVDIVNDVIVLEFGMNKSVRVPVQKAAVAGIMEPDLSVAPVEIEED